MSKTSSTLLRSMGLLALYACTLPVSAQMPPPSPGTPLPPVPPASAPSEPVPGSGMQTAAPAPTPTTGGPTYSDERRPPGTSNASRYPSYGSSYSSEDSFSILPFTRRGYVGLNLGRPKFDSPCGTGPYGCSDPNVGMYLYMGGLLNEWVGLEAGYLNTGQAERGGGTTRSQGVNLSLVLRAPVGAFNVFAKAGATYGQTKVSTGQFSDREAGKRRGWGASYAAGVGVDLTPSSGLVLEWARHNFRFPSAGREHVDTTSLGYVVRF